VDFSTTACAQLSNLLRTVDSNVLRPVLAKSVKNVEEESNTLDSAGQRRLRQRRCKEVWDITP